MKYPNTPEEVAISLDGEITDEIARTIGDKIGIDFAEFDIEEFKKGAASRT